jgi:DNA-binding transcriptional LysR family regulator
MSQTKANLDAWHVLRTVIDAGGFAQAANQLQRSQSAISYSVNKLEEQLGLELLTIQGRRAVLTPNGAQLLARSRDLLSEYEDMLELASELQKGHEQALSVWVDGLCPVQALKPALGEFQTHYPQTQVSLSQGLACQSMGSRQIEQPAADLTITTRPSGTTSLTNLGELTLVAVAHPNHPILGCTPPISQATLKKHRLVSIEAAQEVEDNQNQSVWRVANYHQAIEAVLMGQACGWLPEQSIGNELARGRLKRLELEQGERYQLPVFLQYGEQKPAGPARQALAKLLTGYFTQYL